MSTKKPEEFTFVCAGHKVLMRKVGRSSWEIHDERRGICVNILGEKRHVQDHAHVFIRVYLAGRFDGERRAQRRVVEALGLVSGGEK